MAFRAIRSQLTVLKSLTGLLVDGLRQQVRTVKFDRLLQGGGFRRRDAAADGRERSLRDVWPLFGWPMGLPGSKRLRPLIHARFPLAQAPAAHALMESDRHIGKIILTT